MTKYLIKRENLTYTIELLYTVFVEVLRSHGRVGYVHAYIPDKLRLLAIVGVVAVVAAVVVILKTNNCNKGVSITRTGRLLLNIARDRSRRTE